LRYLLFRQIDTPGLFGDGTGGSGGIYAGPSGFTLNWANNAVGTPLGLGSSYVCGGNECEWPYAYQFVSAEASGLDMYYRPGSYSTYVSDLGSYSASNVVFTSLDLESAADAYAVSWMQTSQTGGFDSRLEPAIAPGANQQGQIHAQADVDGKDSRVITAVSFDAFGSAILISYGWTGDTTTRYDTQTAVVPASEAKSKTAALAGQGYIIGAFGGNDTYGYILVGMRVHGDTLPRAIGFSDTPPYFTPVVYLTEDGVGFLTEQ